MDIKKCIGCIVFLVLAMLTFIFWDYMRIKDQNQKKLQKMREKIEKIDMMSAQASSKEKEQAEIFNKKYSIIYEEDTSAPLFSRFTQCIYVPLGLSNKELKENLLHAAESLKSKKKADSVIIFAYREDDRKHDGGYTAGRFIIYPDSTTKFDIAEVYSKTKKIYPAASKVFINKNNVKLYSKREFEPDDVVTFLKKGTEVMIIEHSRSFATTDFLDLYKVLVSPDKNKKQKKQVVGWVMDVDLEEH